MPHASSRSNPNRLFRSCRRPILSGLGAGACLFVATFLVAQEKPKIPTVNADVGGCTADFVVQDGNHKPIYSAGVDVTFRYGFMNLHKASLEAFTDSNGKARFEGLPDAPKKPLVFGIRHGDRQKTVTDDPLATCNAKFTVVLP